MWRRALLVVVLACLLLLPATSLEPEHSAPTGQASPSATPLPEQRSAGVTPTPEQTALDAYERLTPRQRVGQLFMIGVPSEGADSTELSLLAKGQAGNVYLRTNSTATAAKVLATVTGLVAATTYAGVGPFVATDQEGGNVQRLTGPGFDRMPTALRQGTLSPARLRTLAQHWGAELAQAGLNMDLAPVADVVPKKVGRKNEPIGRYLREYGHFPSQVGSHVAAVVQGFQEAGISTTLKHFPGLGRATANTDTTAGVTDPTTPTDPYLSSFAAGISAGADFVMVSSARYPAIDKTSLACFSPTVIGLLRNELGFDGVIVSDSFDSLAVRHVPVGARAVLFLRAGGTVILDSHANRLMRMEKGVLALEASDPRFAQLVQDAEMHVLLLKAERGLL